MEIQMFMINQKKHEINIAGSEGSDSGDPHQVRPRHLRVRPGLAQVPRTCQIPVSLNNDYL